MTAPDHSRPLEATRQLQRLLSTGPLTLHLTGVGGVGMAGLARLLQQAGHRVSGSDRSPNAWTAFLASAGARILAGHAAEHLPADAHALIRSTAVRDDNPEVARARALGIPVFWRGEALPALANARRTIAITGTHGKTTTTAMTAWVLRACGVPAGHALGGESAQLGFIADQGDGGWLVAEADESDGTIVHYTPSVAVVTNIEFDHMEHFAGVDELRRCYGVFWRQAAARVACLDDPGARRLLADAGLPAVGYGFSSDAPVRGLRPVSDAHGSHCQVELEGRRLGPLRLAVPGRHNLQNALGALAAARLAGVNPGAALEALVDFRPVARRFEVVLDSPALAVVSDYAHHPTEIRTVVEMARTLGRRRMVMIYQPHRYTRTLQLGPDFPPAFEGVDQLILAPVYAASEAPLDGGTSADLARRIAAHGHTPVELAADLDDAQRRARAALHPGDLLLVVGAGDVVSLCGAWTPDRAG